MFLAVPAQTPAVNVPDGKAHQGRKLVATIYHSGFADAHHTFNGMGAASDGKIYYVLCSERYDVGARMYSYDPGTKKIALVGDLTEACGEKDRKTVVQGKSHVNFIEANGKLFFATHLGYYIVVDRMEKPGTPPAGWTGYPGGHLLAYDLKTGKFEDFGIPSPGEGVLTLSMDTRRGRLFALTWPTGSFFRYDLAKKEWKSFGKMCAEGEAGTGATYRTVCRSIAVDLDDGSAYFTTSEGTILRYRADTDSVEQVKGDDLKKDYFGVFNPNVPGHMGYNWRQTFWRAADKMIYGVHGNSGYLFRFDPAAERLEVLDRITSEPSQRCGMFDQFNYGYLGFTLGPSGRTIYYLTGGPIYVDGVRLAGQAGAASGGAKGLENLHLVTWDIPTRKYTDHGAIFYRNNQRPLSVNSIAVSKKGDVYFVGGTTENGKTRADLVEVTGIRRRH